MAKISPQEAQALSTAAGIIKTKLNNTKKGKVLVNGLESFVEGFAGGGIYTPQINKSDTLRLNLRVAPLTIDRPTLNFMYQEIGLIKTAIDQPVDDALRGGVKFKSNELSVDDLKELETFMEAEGIWETIKTTMKWAELFGGAGIIINNGQDYSTRLDVKSMNEKTPLQFYDADRWELGMPNKDDRPDQSYGAANSELFYFYGLPIHRTRVATLKGDTAPSLTRRMLMGWGLSKCERMVRDLNQYIKAQDMIFELLDEAKVDVYRMSGYKSALMRPGGQAKMTRAVGLTNSLKNYLNALVLDKDDEFDQKQITFSGLAEMLAQIRIGVAACLRMPVAKLFGMSAAGFNSGEDDIENYNAMIESDIRSRLRPIIKTVAEVACVKLFGYLPELSFEYHSLRIMSQNEEEDVKSKKQTRILNNYDRGLTTAKETMEAQRSENLLMAEKTAAEEGMTEDFPKRPIDSRSETIKEGADGEGASGKEEDPADPTKKNSPGNRKKMLR